MFSAYQTTQKENMTRLLFLAAVVLACLALPYSAAAAAKPNTQMGSMTEEEEDKAWIAKLTQRAKIPERPYTVYFKSDIPDTMMLVSAARERLRRAKSAGNIAQKPSDPNSAGPSNATVEVFKLRERANKAVESLQTQKDTASPMVKAAAELAKELCDKDTAITLLTNERTKWYGARVKNATEEEPKMTAAVEKMLAAEKSYPGMHPLIMAVMTPAKNIYQNALDAKHDAQYIVYKRIATEMLAERVESLHELVKAEATAAPSDDSCKTKEESKSINATAVAEHRNAAAKAYLAAASAQKIAASCVARIKGNTTLFDKTYYELKELLAKVRRADYEEMHAYQSIADKAHADADECQQIAAGTPEYAAAYVQTAKKHLDSITTCVDDKEAQWHAGEALKASRSAQDEMQYALSQLSKVTVSVQEVIDAKQNVTESKALTEADKENEGFENHLTTKTKPAPAPETDEEKQANAAAEKDGMKMPRMREQSKEEREWEQAENGVAVRKAKNKAVLSEKEAETSYEAVRAHADTAANTVHHITDIVDQVKRLAAQVPKDKKGDKKTDIDEQLKKAEAALQSANVSSNDAQAAAAAVYDTYNQTKNAVDAALRNFDKTVVEHFQSTADSKADTTKTSITEKQEKAKKALGDVEKQKAEALAAFNEMNKLVEEIGQKNGFDTLKLKSAKTATRDSATAPSLLPVTVAVLCVVAASVLGAV